MDGIIIGGVVGALVIGMLFFSKSNKQYDDTGIGVERNITGGRRSRRILKNSRYSRRHKNIH
jgi:nitrogen fixation-related uncharacterized protein